MRFIHMADIHLGYRQYGSDTRENDFARAWLWCCDYAVDAEADFVLIAGDLFHHGSVAPLTLMQAMAGLSLLRNRSIPVFAIAGNHDRARLSDATSWLQFLEGEELLQLVCQDIGPSGVDSVCELHKGFKIVGLQYVGSATPKVLPMIAERLARFHDDKEYTILMLHGGLAEETVFGANFGMDDLNSLRREVEYVALGHIHKFYQREDWAYNPGSPEACSVDEADSERYILDVMVDLESKETSVEQITVPGRDFWRPEVDVTDYDSPETLYDRLVHVLMDDPGMNDFDMEFPVVELTLTGTLQFPRAALDIERLKAAVVACQASLVVRIANKTTSVEAVGMNVDPDSSREEIERRAVSEIFAADGRYAKRVDDWTDLTLDAKQMSLDGLEPAEISDRIQEVATC